MGDQKQISICPLSDTERGRLLQHLEPLVQLLGSPGDWGYGSRLGDLTTLAKDVYLSLRASDAQDYNDA